MALFISAGFVAEKLFKRIFTRRYFQFDKSTGGGLSVDVGQSQLCKMDKLTSILVKITPDIVGLFIFAAVATLSYLTFIWTSSPFVQLFFVATLMTITMIRAIIILSQIIFSPTIIQFRILPMHCGTANTLHKLLIWAGGYMLVAIMFSVVVFKLGAQPETIQLLQIFMVSILLFTTAAATIIYRKNIREQILLSAEGEPTWGRKKFADIWHILALLYIAILWFLIINPVDSSPETRSRAAFFFSFFIVPIWLVMNRLVQWLVSFFF